MRIRSTKKDVIWNYIGIIVSMSSNFILLPFMMRLIDADHLGLWYVYLSIGGIVTLFDFGFNPTLARNVAYVWSGAEQLSAEGLKAMHGGEPNYRLLGKVIKTCKLIYLVISSIALMVLLTLGSLHIFKISSSIIDLSVVVSWIIYAIAVFLNLYYGYFASFLRGVGAVSEYNRINVLARIVQMAVSIGLMYCGLGIIAVSLAYLLYGLLLRVLSKRVFYGYGNIAENINKINEKVDGTEIKKLFVVVWHNAWRDGLVYVANYCASQASTLIASNYFSLRETGIYSISVQLINAIVNIAAALYTAYQPAMQSAYVNKDNQEAKKLMSVAMVTYVALFCFGLIGLETIGIPLLSLVRPDYEYDKLVILGIAVYNFFYRMQSYYASFISNTNHVPYVKAYIISGVAGIILATIFVKSFNLGLWGLILGQFLSQIVYNCWKWPRVVHRMLNTSFFDMVKTGVVEISKAGKKSMGR